jgi:hypothetical protein
VQRVGAAQPGPQRLVSRDLLGKRGQSGGLTIEYTDEVESARHTWLTPSGLAEALPKPDKPLSWYPAIPRQHILTDSGHPRFRYSCLVQPVLACSPSRSAEILRPATALPVTLVGRDSHGYYGLSAPVSALVISRSILAEAGDWFRRCSCRKCCAAVGALSTPWPGIPGVERAMLDVRPLWLPLSRTNAPVAGQVPNIS